MNRVNKAPHRRAKTRSRRIRLQLRPRPNHPDPTRENMAGRGERRGGWGEEQISGTALRSRPLSSPAPPTGPAPSRIEAVAARGRVLVAHHREVQRHHRAARPHDEPHNVVHVVAGARAGGRRRGPRLSVFKAISIDSFLSPQKRGDDTVRTPSTATPPPPLHPDACLWR